MKYLIFNLKQWYGSFWIQFGTHSIFAHLWITRGRFISVNCLHGIWQIQLIIFYFPALLITTLLRFEMLRDNPPLFYNAWCTHPPTVSSHVKSSALLIFDTKLSPFWNSKGCHPSWNVFALYMCKANTFLQSV